MERETRKKDEFTEKKEREARKRMRGLVTEDQQREEYPKRDKVQVREEKEKRKGTKRMDEW